ncbi:MAG: nucleotidyltransferase domain-containing protein [Chloroflexi bacterium]|uniref:nucleotidyltransferase family protein n=1 Tax=Candidatus Flexifilum breve TaxID=3140694 RepID=UPI003137668E|nr:nucleotidyltransferase domain-containing protein [Chloroflexota bacterium]
MMIKLPDDKQAFLDDLLPRLTAVPGMAAVVIGGSLARGTARPDSDLDLALYYHDAAPFDLAAIRAIAEAISAEGTPTVTGFYQWGAWVNGGAWIKTRAGKVDFLYRSVEHVRRTIDEAHAGHTHTDYEQQPTFGFHSTIYLAETHDCVPVYDPDGVIAAPQSGGRDVSARPQSTDDHGQPVERGIHALSRAGLRGHRGRLQHGRLHHAHAVQAHACCMRSMRRISRATNARRTRSPRSPSSRKAIWRLSSPAAPPRRGSRRVSRRG